MNTEGKEGVKWKYNTKTHCVDEQPTIKEPHFIKWGLASSHIKDNDMDDVRKYKVHIASLRHILVIDDKVDWKDSEDVTGKFVEDERICVSMGCANPDCLGGCLFPKIVAIPIKQAGTIPAPYNSKT